MSNAYDVPKPMTGLPPEAYRLGESGWLIRLIQNAFGGAPTVPPAPPAMSPAFDAGVPQPPRPLSRAPVPPGGSRDFSIGVPTVPQISAAAPNLLPQPPMLPQPPTIPTPASIDLGPLKTLLQQKADVSGAQSLLTGGGINSAPIEALLAQRTNVDPIRAALAQMKPDASSHMANVLGGLSSGAGGVSAIEPGSFAKALAMAGAGGMGGLAKSGQEFRDYATKNASGEFDIAKLLAGERQHEATGRIDLEKAKSTDIAHRAGGLINIGQLQSGERGQNITGTGKVADIEAADKTQQAEIAYKNAAATYETGVKNELTKFQQQTETRGALMPKIQHDANGITIQRVDPDTGQLKVQFHPTKTILDNAEKMKPMLEALGLPGAGAEAEEAKFVMNSFPDPVLKQEALKNLAVRRTIANGAGGSVFGPMYETAVKAATKQLQAENPTLVAKPEVYQQEINSRIASIIMSDPRIHNLAWTKYAAPHSVAARLIADGLMRKETPTGGE